MPLFAAYVDDDHYALIHAESEADVWARASLQGKTLVRVEALKVKSSRTVRVTK